jgi:hypothetical protein
MTKGNTFTDNRSLGRSPGLPPGTSQPDCDGFPDPFARAGDSQLWLACDDRQRIQIAQDFALARPEAVRDAILDSQDSGTARQLGRALWQCWISYRRKALNQLHQQGLIQFK